MSAVKQLAKDSDVKQNKLIMVYFRTGLQLLCSRVVHRLASYGRQGGKPALTPGGTSESPIWCGVDAADHVWMRAQVQVRRSGGAPRLLTAVAPPRAPSAPPLRVVSPLRALPPARATRSSRALASANALAPHMSGNRQRDPPWAVRSAHWRLSHAGDAGGTGGGGGAGGSGGAG